MIRRLPRSLFFNDTATTEIYALSLHDALPICVGVVRRLLPLERSLVRDDARVPARRPAVAPVARRDRKSTRLNSSHANISYAVFCLKKQNIASRLLCATITRRPQITSNLRTLC